MSISTKGRSVLCSLLSTQRSKNFHGKNSPCDVPMCKYAHATTEPTSGRIVQCIKHKNNSKSHLSLSDDRCIRTNFYRNTSTRTCVIGIGIFVVRFVWSITLLTQCLSLVPTCSAQWLVVDVINAYLNATRECLHVYSPECIVENLMKIAFKIKFQHL